MDGRATWGPVRVAWAQVPAGAAASIPSEVGAAQLARLKALPDAQKARFAAGRILLARLLTEIAGPDADPRLDTVCERCGGAHGRARHGAGQIALSLSYAGDLVVAAAAATDETRDIGVDVERGDTAGAARVAELGRLFAPAPAPTLEEWTRIEAVLKADGRGLRVEPWAVRFAPRGDGFDARTPGSDVVWRVATIPGPAGPDGFVVSVAAGSGVRSAR